MVQRPRRRGAPQRVRAGARLPDPAVFNDYPGSRSPLVAGHRTKRHRRPIDERQPSSSDIVWEATLYSKEDTQPPLITSQTPPPGTAIRDLAAIEIVFSEPVSGVDAADLLINGREPQTSRKWHRASSSSRSRVRPPAR